MRLSILTLSLHTRVERFLPRIIATLHGQIGDLDVELLCFLDNQRVSVGRKWNTLIGAATGKYITVVGDDDLVADTYVQDLLDAIDAADGVPCIVFDSEFYRDGQHVARVHWGLEYEYRDDFEHGHLWRPPGELMAIRSDIRKEVLYPDVWRGSDWRQAKMMLPRLTEQHRIKENGEAKSLYLMYNRSNNDEHIRAQQRANQLRRDQRAAQREAL